MEIEKGKWYLVEDELPPIGMPIVGMYFGGCWFAGTLEDGGR
jgi:hypothetical protein